jgi:hypothetical protein
MSFQILFLLFPEVSFLLIPLPCGRWRREDYLPVVVIECPFVCFTNNILLDKESKGREE